MVKPSEKWQWSSYLVMTGQSKTPEWLAVGGLLAQFSKQRPAAIRRYQAFVAEGMGVKSIWSDLKGLIFLGSEAFVSRMQAIDKGLSNKLGVPKAQARPPAPTLEVLASRSKGRDEVIVVVYATGSYSYQQIAVYYGLHFTMVGKIVSKGTNLEEEMSFLRVACQALIPGLPLLVALGSPCLDFRSPLLRSL